MVIPRFRVVRWSAWSTVSLVLFAIWLSEGVGSLPVQVEHLAKAPWHLFGERVNKLWGSGDDDPLSSSPLQLPFVLRNFVQEQLPSTRYEYNLLELDSIGFQFNTTEKCPRTLEFEEISFGEPPTGTQVEGQKATALFPAPGLLIDGSRCEGGDFVVFDSTAATQRTNIYEEISRQTVLLLVRNSDSSPRITCGGFIFTNETIMEAVYSETPIRVDRELQDVSLPVEQKLLFMAFLQPGQAIEQANPDCVYQEAGGGGLSGGAIAGIVIGCVAGVVIIVGGLFFFFSRRREAEGKGAVVEEDIDPYNVDDILRPPNEPGDD